MKKIISIPNKTSTDSLCAWAVFGRGRKWMSITFCHGAVAGTGISSRPITLTYPAVSSPDHSENQHLWICLMNLTSPGSFEKIIIKKEVFMTKLELIQFEENKYIKVISSLSSG